jgi:hypothetical protein
MSEHEAWNWPDLMHIVQSKVKPARAHLTTNEIGKKRAASWWIYGSSAKDLYDSIRGLSRILACVQTSKYRTVTFLPANVVFDQKLIVFRFDSDGAFALLQSQVHVNWALFFGSTLEDRPVYTPSDCFETFPCPENFEVQSTLERVGRDLYESRAAIMVKNGQGLTETYNRFHDPEERDSQIVRLRELHAAMDRAVLDAYGWTDLQSTCEFLLDYEDEDVHENGVHRRKRPWRYRWPDEIRDEVLARLLELNRQRAVEEAVAREGQTSSGRAKLTRGNRGKSKASVEPPLVPGLLSEEKQ